MSETSSATLRRQAVEAIQRGDFQAAVQPLMHCVSASPQDVEAMTLLAIALSQTGQPDAALALLDRAATAQPGSAAIHYNHAMVLARAGKTDDARAAFGRALEIEPTHAQARRQLDALGPAPQPLRPITPPPAVAPAPPQPAAAPAPAPFQFEIPTAPPPRFTLPVSEPPVTGPPVWQPKQAEAEAAPPWQSGEAGSGAGLVRCPRCTQGTPMGTFCAVCGAPLPPTARPEAPPVTLAAAMEKAGVPQIGESLGAMRVASAGQHFLVLKSFDWRFLWLGVAGALGLIFALVLTIYVVGLYMGQTGPERVLLTEQQALGLAALYALSLAGVLLLFQVGRSYEVNDGARTIQLIQFGGISRRVWPHTAFSRVQLVLQPMGRGGHESITLHLLGPSGKSLINLGSEPARTFAAVGVAGIALHVSRLLSVPIVASGRPDVMTDELREATAGIPWV